MKEEYKTMLDKVTVRLNFIKEEACHNDDLNLEWQLLWELQNTLIKLLKYEGRE